MAFIEARDCYKRLRLWYPLHTLGAMLMVRSSELLTLREAAEIAGLSATTLRVQIHNKRLNAVKKGRDWFITRKALDSYIENVARGGEAE